MSTARNARITLELEPGADPIRGSIEHPDGSHQTFWGWLELSAELRRISTEAAPHTEPHQRTNTQEQS
jgi:hypothetical protein